MLRIVEDFNFIFAVILTVAYAYQLGYLGLGLIYRRRACTAQPSRLRRYAAVISARNEANVIAGLVESLKAQNYPRELLDIYVIADNCTDNTAEVASSSGAIVYRRFNQVQVGKGYALNYLFDRLREENRDDYDGYFVFDADNYVDPNFVREMNRTFDSGKYAALTSYRNSKNFGANWISAGYGLWFLRESRFLNFPRMLLGTSCAISGTGFLVSAQTIRDNGGWPYHLLTEDIEFSVNCALQGKRIGYCDKAVIYDEQPESFRQSWDQRLRWSKGFYQVDFKYGAALARRSVSLSRGGFSCYDMLMTVAPGMLLTLTGILFNLAILVSCLTEPPRVARLVAMEAGSFILSAVGMFYLGLFLYGVITTMTEWRQIQMPAYKKVFYTLTFPVFMFTYVPISIAALVRKVEWKPIYHGNTARTARGAGKELRPER